MTADLGRGRRTQPLSAEPSRSPSETPRERFLAAAKALSHSIEESVHASKTRLRDATTSTLARHAPVAASFLQRTPTLGRIRELSEAPEKAIVVGTAAAVSNILPATTPIVGGAARAIEKQIDLAREPDQDVRSR
jgi:hypothetical protein